MRLTAALATAVMLALGVAHAQSSRSVLFIGNSFIYGSGSAVRFYRADTVTDLNQHGVGGVPALFKSFAAQAGLDYDVYVETEAGSGLEFHLEQKRDAIGLRGWDHVVMHGQSTLDFAKPGDPAKLIATARQMAEFLREWNANVEIHLMSSWSRADQTYPEHGAWAGKPIEAMARDLRAAYDKAAAGAPNIKSVIPVGEAWTRAMHAGFADPNPYDGIEAGKINLWAYDAYHASTHGYYLEALMIFGRLTGRDPRSLGENECSAFELGLPRGHVTALQQIAFDQLAAEGSGIMPAPLVVPPSAVPLDSARGGPVRCTHR